MTKSTKGSTVVATRDVLSTKDYDIFRIMEGNRDVDLKHVQQLQKLMLENGNLTYEFPIIVNEHMFVIDGQHRLTALKELGWEVGYTIQSETTIETVRAINRGQRNWAWFDIAQSYAKLGYDDYQWFVWFTRTYGLNLTAGMAFATGLVRGSRRAFLSGDFEVKDKTTAVKRAEQYRAVSDASGVDNSAFASAFADIQKSPFYDHERMVRKADELSTTIPRAATKTDYKRTLEEVFNHKLSEDNKVRLF